MENLKRNLFNVKSDRIEKLETINNEKGLEVHIRLKKDNDELYRPYCNRQMYGNGIKRKPINHTIFTDRNMKVLYEARRYRCKSCGYSRIE